MPERSSEILFITRNYPPKVGGLEKYSFQLIEAFAASIPTHKITLSKSKKHLVWFLPYALLKALYLARKCAIQNIHLCDGLLAPLGLMLKYSTGSKISVSIHGLDITFPNRIYQKFIPGCIRRLDAVVCVSRATREELLKRVSLPEHKITVIPNGIIPGELSLSLTKEALLRQFETLTGFSIPKGKILLTLGHLVKRKGVAWFVEQVFPSLSQEYVYLVAGKGPEKKAVQRAIARHKLENRVFLLGEVSNELRNILYNVSDVFVMPNITVPGDVEGFGIVAIEAASCGLPVVASNIQGLRDAVMDGKTGYLVGEGGGDGFLKAIDKMDFKKEDTIRVLNEAYSWKRISSKYQQFIKF